MLLTYDGSGNLINDFFFHVEDFGWLSGEPEHAEHKWVNTLGDVHIWYDSNSTTHEINYWVNPFVIAAKSFDNVVSFATDTMDDMTDAIFG